MQTIAEIAHTDTTRVLSEARLLHRPVLHRRGRVVGSDAPLRSLHRSRGRGQARSTAGYPVFDARLENH
mgnify:CR=1 FL=1